MICVKKLFCKVEETGKRFSYKNVDDIALGEKTGRGIRYNAIDEGAVWELRTYSMKMC